MCEAAQAAANCKNTEFQHLFKTLSIRRGRKKAIMAVAHKIARIAYTLLTRREVYRIPEVSREILMAQKNAPRWRKQLKALEESIASGKLDLKSKRTSG